MNEPRDRAADVIAGRGAGTHAEAVYLAHELVKALADKEQFVDHVATVQARCSDLLHNQQLLKDAIYRIANAHPDDRDGLIAEALVVVGGTQ